MALDPNIILQGVQNTNPVLAERPDQVAQSVANINQTQAQTSAIPSEIAERTANTDFIKANTEHATIENDLTKQKMAFNNSLGQIIGQQKQKPSASPEHFDLNSDPTAPTQANADALNDPMHPFAQHLAPSPTTAPPALAGQPDASGVISSLQPGQKADWKSKNGLYTDSSGDYIAPYDAPAVNPNGTRNIYSAKTIDDQVDALRAAGQPEYLIQDYQKQAHDNALKQSDAVVATVQKRDEAIKAQVEAQKAQADMQAIRTKLVSNSAYDIANTPGGDDKKLLALQTDLAMNPDHLVQYGLGQPNPDDPHSPIPTVDLPQGQQQALNNIAQLAKTSEKAKESSIIAQNMGQANRDNATANEVGKKVEKIQVQDTVKDANGDPVIDPATNKPKLLFDPTTNAPVMKDVYATYDLKNNKITTTDVAPTQSNSNNAKISAQNQRYAIVFNTNHNEAVQHLQNIAKMGAKVDSGISTPNKTGFWNTAGTDLRNKLNSDDVTNY